MTCILLGRKGHSQSNSETSGKHVLTNSAVFSRNNVAESQSGTSYQRYQRCRRRRSSLSCRARARASSATYATSSSSLVYPALLHTANTFVPIVSLIVKQMLLYYP